MALAHSAEIDAGQVDMHCDDFSFDQPALGHARALRTEEPVGVP
jgi:hypothetical protein